MQSTHGFVQRYNAQAAVDTATMRVIAQHIRLVPNDQREVTPALERLAALPPSLGKGEALQSDSSYCSPANIAVIDVAGIQPMLALQRESHHLRLHECFTVEVVAADTNNAMQTMANRLNRRAGRALYALRKQTVEPVFGIIKRVMGWRQMTMRGLAAARGCRRR